MSNNHTRNTEGLKKFAVKRQLATAKKVDDTIQRLINKVEYC